MNTLYPNSSDSFLIPRSSVVLIGKSDGTKTHLQLVPDSSREHLYLTVNNVEVLKPAFPRSCSDVRIKINSPYGILQTKFILSISVTNVGKVENYDLNASLAVIVLYVSLIIGWQHSENEFKVFKSCQSTPFFVNLQEMDKTSIY